MTTSQYFQCYYKHFWQWEEQGTVLAIPDGPTVLYWSQAVQQLSLLAVQRLPPFGAFLLAMIATNKNGKRNIDLALKTVKRISSTAVYEDEYEQARVFLNRLVGMPELYKTGTKRTMLLQLLFEETHNSLSHKDSRQIIADIRAYGNNQKLNLNKIDLDFGIVRRDLRIFALLDRKYGNVNSLIQAMVALPELAESLPEIETELEPEELPEDLIEALLQKEATFHVGALVKRIWSGINIPFHSTIPSQQPFGGLADITNKGAFDKLLFSEYANEDLVFLSRLANNEALFYNREIPPSDNDLERVLLLDVSLKNWGTLKTIAFATMLAIAKHPKSEIPCRAILLGKGFYPIEIDTVHQLIDALQILESSLHSTKGLESYFREADLSNKELIFIGAEDCFKEEAFQSLLSNHNWPINYRIHPTAEGYIHVYKKQNKGTKHVQTLKLPLQQLWEKKQKQPKVKTRPKEASATYPLLFPKMDGKRVICMEDGQLFLVQKPGMLLRFFFKENEAQSKGLELCLSDLPFTSGDFAVTLNSKGEHVFLGFRVKDRKLVLINLKTKDRKEIEFREWKSSPYPQWLGYKGHFYYLGRSSVWRVDMQGNILSGLAMPIDLYRFYRQYEQRLNGLGRTMLSQHSVLRNIKRVAISRSGFLHFNGTHQLLKDPNGTILLQHAQGLPVKMSVEAKRASHWALEFPDGSQVQFSKTGMLVLKSSNESLPEIFIPGVLNHPLGVSTKEMFSGNKYYYPSLNYDLLLKDAGRNKTRVIEIIKSHLDISTAPARIFVDDAPKYLGSYLPHEKARWLQESLEAVGADVQLEKKGQILTILPGNQFYKKYIQSFIYHALKEA